MRRHAQLRSVERQEHEPTVQNQTTNKLTDPRALTGERNNVLSLMNEMERLINDSFNRTLGSFGMLPLRRILNDFTAMGSSPSIDMFEEGGELVIKAELPGMRKEDINVKLVDNTLTISGENRAEEKVEQKNYMRLERQHGSFTRTLTLPEGLDLAKVQASYQDGILELRIVRNAREGSVRQIAIN